MQYNQRKFIFSSRLARVINLVLQQSVYDKSENSCSYDFERAAPIIDKLGLHRHIYIKSRHLGTVPLNSENHVYDIDNVIIKGLNIRVTNNSSWKDYIAQKPFFFLKWHFEDCIFESYSSTRAISFPWKGNFRLYKTILFAIYLLVLVSGYLALRKIADIHFIRTTSTIRTSRFFLQ